MTLKARLGRIERRTEQQRQASGLTWPEDARAIARCFAFAIERNRRNKDQSS